jgi:hypothetical protein
METKTMVEESPHYYCNSTNVISSIYDVLLAFRAQSPASISPDGQPSALVTTQEFTVHMSPQHAKAMATLLMKHVLAYEEQFKISLPLPDDIKAIWDSLPKGVDQ